MWSLIEALVRGWTRSGLKQFRSINERDGQVRGSTCPLKYSLPDFAFQAV